MLPAGLRPRSAKTVPGVAGESAADDAEGDALGVAAWPAAAMLWPSVRIVVVFVVGVVVGVLLLLLAKADGRLVKPNKCGASPPPPALPGVTTPLSSESSSPVLCVAPSTSVAALPVDVAPSPPPLPENAKSGLLSAVLRENEKRPPDLLLLLSVDYNKKKRFFLKKD